MASLNATTALGLQTLLQPQVRRDLLAPNAPVAPRAMMVGQDPALSAFWQVAIPVSAGLSGYHGYKRNNDSLGWGLVWGLLGATFPIVTPAVAYAQGFGTRAR